MISPSSFAVFALKFLQKSMMFTPCGPSAVPTGGAGVALPAAIWSFTIACTFLAIAFQDRPRNHESTKHVFQDRCVRVFVVSWLDFLHLQEIQFDRRRSSEDRHHHLQGALVEIHVVDDAV